MSLKKYRKLFVEKYEYKNEGLKNIDSLNKIISLQVEVATAFLN